MAPEDFVEFKKVADNLKIIVEFDGIGINEVTMSQDQLDVSSTNDLTDDWMEVMESNPSMSSLKPRNSSKGSLKHAITMTAPESKKMKFGHKNDSTSKNQLPLPMKRSLALPNSGIVKSCVYCDRNLREKDRNYHQKYCMKNPNRIVSDCSICLKKCELPSKLRMHMVKSHPGHFKI